VKGYRVMKTDFGRIGEAMMFVLVLALAALPSSDGCQKTAGGSGNGNCCAFPFRYQGEEYNECITLNNNNKKWCYTGTNGEWGNCVTGVSCGHHRAPNCNECTGTNGASWCNGDCSWNDKNGKCELKGNGEWGTWTSYGKCSKTCGAGTQIRSRDCNNPSPAFNGATCSGSGSQSRPCKVKECPINGGWGTWTSYGKCSKSCGAGTKIRNRDCNNPSPAFNGATCSGSGSQSKHCIVKTCPEPCGGNVTLPTTIRYPTTGKYDDNVDCIWNIQIKTWIDVTFTMFELEEDVGCHNDYVKMGDKKKICGKVIPSPYMNEWGMTKLIFHSNQNKHFRGFEVKIAYIMWGKR